MSILRYEIIDGEMLLPLPREWNLLQVIGIHNASSFLQTSFQLLPISAILFIFGSLLALLTPLGCFPQTAGFVLFPITIIDRIGRHQFYDPSSGYWIFEEVELLIGLYLALIASAITAISLLRPIGINYKRGPFERKARLLNFNRLIVSPPSQNDAKELCGK
jgi:hypothetical protein